MNDAIKGRIETWEGDNGVWYGKSEYIDILGNEQVFTARGHDRSDVLDQIEDDIVRYYQVQQKAEATRQVHETWVVPEGAGVRVRIQDDIEEEGDDET